MNENIVGKNIKYWRKQRGEKQETLGRILNLTKSAISDYERGRITPNSECLKLIAEHYGITVDEMLNTKFYELASFNTDEMVDCAEVFDMLQKILPLQVSSKIAYKNDSFSQAITLIMNLLDQLKKGECVEASILVDAMEYFEKAAKENIYEAHANMLWCIFFIWWQQYADLRSVKKIQSRLILKQINWKEIMDEAQKNEKKIVGKRKVYIDECDNLLNELIKTLKSKEEWGHLGDYYLALRYVFGIINTGLSEAMNKAMGMQMMCTLVQLGNKYATDFFMICNDKK